MAVETVTIVKRTIWVSACVHDKQIEVDDPGRKQRYCNKCDKWIPYLEESYTGSGLTGIRDNMQSRAKINVRR